MFPVTCNAVGDILALAILVLDFAQALDETSGSSADYRALNSELKSLHIVLASVNRVAELTVDELLREQIFREVERCGGFIRDTLERIAKFSLMGRDVSTADTTRVRVKRQWYKIEWLIRKDSIDSIRDELASVTQRLATYLTVSNA